MKKTKFLRLKLKPYGRINAKKYRLKTLFLLILGLFASLWVSYTINWFITSYNEATNYSVFIPKISVAKAKSFNSIQDEVNYYLDERNVSADFRTNLFCLIDNESGWDTETTMPIIRKNGKISIDMGLLQWNSQTAPVKVTKACAYNTKCTINTFIDYINEGGDWNRWFGFRDNCR